MTLKVVPNRKIWFTISGALFVLSIVGYAIWGLKFGIDFTGGSLMELEFQQVPPKEELIKAIKDAETGVNAKIDAAIKNPALAKVDEKSANPFPVPTAPIEFGDPLLTPISKGYAVRLKTLDPYSHEEIKAALVKQYPGMVEKKFVTIGATVGESIRQNAYISLAVVLAGMILFIAYAFRKVPKNISPWKFGVTAVVAMFHDVFVPIGIFVLLGQLLHVEVESFIITALLTVMGFSVHDTIVVFDRIRENLQFQKKDETFADIAEKSVHQTFARSINTSVTTFITLLFLFIFGSESIRWFVFTMIIGIVIGTYSSIFIAAPLLVAWKEKEAK